MKNERKLKQFQKFLIRLTRFLWDLNIIKTIWINFKLLPFLMAIKFPIFVYGKIRLELKGRLVFKCPIKSGILKVGYKYEMQRSESGIAEFHLLGTFLLRGSAWFGIDTFVHVKKDAYLEIWGDDFKLGSRSYLICFREIVISRCVRIGYESVVSDSSYHYIKDLETNTILDCTGKIFLGSNNFIGGRSMIYKNTITPDYCIVASNSLCNKDYKSFIPEYSMIGGLPAKLLKSNCVRVFDQSKEYELDELFNMMKVASINDFDSHL